MKRIAIRSDFLWKLLPLVRAIVTHHIILAAHKLDEGQLKQDNRYKLELSLV